MIIDILLQPGTISRMVTLIYISLVRLHFCWICSTLSCVIFIKLCHHNGTHSSQHSVGKWPIFLWLGAVITRYYWEGVGSWCGERCCLAAEEDWWKCEARDYSQISATSLMKMWGQRLLITDLGSIPTYFSSKRYCWLPPI